MTTAVQEIIDLVEQQGAQIKTWKESQDAKIAELTDAFEKKHMIENRPRLGGGSTPPTQWIDTKSQRPVSVLTHDQPIESKTSDTPSMGRVLRGLVLGGRAHDARQLEDERKAMSIGVDPAGGYTVAGVLANEWIDLLRANMVLSQAGCRTIPMESGTLSLARVTGDPAVSWHGENAALTDSDVTLGSVNLHAKTVVCLVKLSLELSQDSANIEQILETTITKAMANAIDSAGINGVTVDAGAAPSGIINMTGRSKVTSIGAPTSWDFVTDGMYQLMLNNTTNIGALVAHPILWKKMRKLKTGITSDNTPLSAPAEIAALPKLWTTAAPLATSTATGIIADWRDLLFGVRQDISVKVLSETFMGSNLQLAVLAYARVDFAATREASFCTLEGITCS
jgi:HK97 family phage major capsid protein